MKSVLSIVSMISCFIAFGEGFDWSSASGDVVVPPGSTYVVTQADMGKVNALSSITVSGAGEGAEPGVLEFQNCTTLPKAELIKGEGVVKKTGTEVWNYTATQSGFNGDFRICGGQVVTTVSGSFGRTDKTCAGAIYVESGASLKIASKDVKFCYRAVRIAGAGFGSDPADKALCVDTACPGAVAILQLDADAAVYVRNNGNHYWMGSIGSPFGDNNNGSQILTEGFTLTKTGAMDWYMYGLTFAGGGRVINAEGRIILREGSDLDTSDSEPLETAVDTTIQYYNNPNVVKRPLQIDGVTLFDYNTNESADWRHPLLTTNTCNWAGDVLLNGQGSKLMVSMTFAANADSGLTDKAHDLQRSFMGNVSGAGSVEIGSSDRKGKGVVVFGGHNAYTGATYFYGGYSSRLVAYWADSIPDYAKATVDRGFIVAKLGLAADGETERWPRAKIFELHNRANFLDGGALAVDASECENGLFEMSVSELLEKDENPDIGWGSAGGTVRITSEEGDDLRICPNAYCGTLELTGSGTYRIAGTNEIACVVGAATDDNTAKVVVKDGARVLQGKLPVFLGRKYDYAGNENPKAPGRLEISNAQWLSTITEIPSAGTQDGLLENALYVGSFGVGILDIQSGGFVSNKVVVGGGQLATAGSRGDGAVYVGNGGRLHITPGGTRNYYASMLGMGGYGYLEVAPGASVVAEAPFGIGGYGCGVFHQYGGAYSQVGNLAIDGMNSGNGVLYIAGGTCTIGDVRNESGAIVTCNNGNSTRSVAQITVDGPDTVLDVGKRTLNATDGPDGSNRNCTFVNLNNGGTLVIDRIQPFAKGRVGTEKAIYLNFNGGCIRKNYYYKELAYSNPSLLSIAVYENGAAFDCQIDSTIDPRCPIEGHVEGGIQAIDASAALDENWIGAPYVLISGSGQGAAAVADWDRVTRKLKGIKITSRGWGYAPNGVTVTVSTQQKSVTISGAAVTVGDNVIGGFTMTGSKTMTLAGTNSWQKWTQIDGGTFKVGSNGAIPANTELRLNGGTLDLNGFDADAERPVTFSGLAGTGGVVKNGTAKLTGEWKISAQRFVDRTTTTVTGTLDLSAVTKIVLTDAEVLDDEEVQGLRRMTLFSATDVIWPATIAFEGVPEGWSIKRSANGMRLGFDRGFVLTVR